MIFRTTCLALLGLTLASSLARAQELPAGPMRDTVQAACTTCHVADQFATQRRTRPQWAETVNTMIGMGAVVGDNEFDKLVDYLAEHFAPGK